MFRSSTFYNRNRVKRHILRARTELNYPTGTFIETSTTGNTVLMTFNAIDVETANHSRGSICQIGICSVINGEIGNRWETLVNPETDFNPYNVAIHGIGDADVKSAPTLPGIYTELCERVQDSVVVHHSPFDKTAFEQATSKYNLHPLPVIWLDSVKIAKRAWPKFASSYGYGLESLTKYFGIQFQHHNAVEDARAAALIVLQACKDTGWDIEEFLHRIN